MPSSPDLGLYEALIDQVLAQRLATAQPDLVKQHSTVEDAELPLLLADHAG